LFARRLAVDSQSIVKLVFDPAQCLHSRQYGQIWKSGRPTGQVSHAPQKEGDVEERLRQKSAGRKQAIAIGLSEARKKGAKVPRKKGGSRKRR
jgi:hypothetical protein